MTPLTIWFSRHAEGEPDLEIDVQIMRRSAAIMVKGLIIKKALPKAEL